MPYLPATTIGSNIAKIERKELILPAIQREFVWKPRQIVTLFDSIMRGYPIGSFLSWKIQPSTAQEFRFYDFLGSFNALDQRHNPELDVDPTQPVVAVLDGQQRLTSLNIGLRGTYAWKIKYAWSGFRGNYPARTLHLNLRGQAPENPAGLLYDFRFLSEKQLQEMDEVDARYWLPVPEVYSAGGVVGLWQVLADRDLANDKTAREIAMLLAERIHSDHSVHFYEETEQDIERVLDIFIRVNSGGTVLSYSDLLLSIATAQWKDRDARNEVHSLVDELNDTGHGFRLSKDLVLKTGLVLSGVPDVGFKVENFTAANMARLEELWDDITHSLRLAVSLLSDFGLSGKALTANSLVIPLAMYVQHRKLDQAYREHPAETSDRENLKAWVMRALIVPGVWGSGLDQLLRALRSTITEHADSRFPVEEIDRMMAGRGKSLVASEDLIDSILEYSARDGETFGVLAIAFPHVNTRNIHHVDHIYPRAKLGRPVLRKAGLTAQEAEEVISKRDRLPNLQLIEGPENIVKSSKLPQSWAQDTFTSIDSYSAYLDRNAIPELSDDPKQFLRFYEERKALLKERIQRAFQLGDTASKPQSVTSDDGTDVPPLDESVEAGEPEAVAAPGLRDAP